MSKHTEKHLTRMDFKYGEILRVHHNVTGQLIETFKVVGFNRPSKEYAGQVTFEVTRHTHTQRG